MKGMDIEIEEKEGDASLNSALDNSRIKGLISDYQKYDLSGSIRRIIVHVRSQALGILPIPFLKIIISLKFSV